MLRVPCTSSLFPYTTLFRSNKFVLLEGIHPSAVETLKSAGYNNIEYHKVALSKSELKDVLKDARFIGIRSRTHLTKDIIDAAPKLAGIGCFCIGTNQVELDAATVKGIPVFNAPFSNRSEERRVGKECR